MSVALVVVPVVPVVLVVLVVLMDLVEAVALVIMSLALSGVSVLLLVEECASGSAADETAASAQQDRRVPPAPRPAAERVRAAAHAAALVCLPSGLWRLSLVAGVHSGYTDAGYDDLNAQGWGGVWLAFLSLGSEALALMTLLLVFPRDRAVTRRLGPRAVVRIGTGAAVVLTLLWAQFLLWWAVPHHDMTATGSGFVGLLYLPLVAWGPLLWVVVRAYRRQHEA